MFLFFSSFSLSPLLPFYISPYSILPGSLYTYYRPGQISPLLIAFLPTLSLPHSAFLLPFAFSTTSIFSFTFSFSSIIFLSSIYLFNRHQIIQMAAPRSTSLRALRILSQQHSATPSLRRGLHITGVNSAQPANVADRASLYTAQSVPELKQECQKRSLRAIGSKTEVCHCPSTSTTKSICKEPSTN